MNPPIGTQDKPSSRRSVGNVIISPRWTSSGYHGAHAEDLSSKQRRKEGGKKEDVDAIGEDRQGGDLFNGSLGLSVKRDAGTQRHNNVILIYSSRCDSRWLTGRKEENATTLFIYLCTTSFRASPSPSRPLSPTLPHAFLGRPRRAPRLKVIFPRPLGADNDR